MKIIALPPIDAAPERIRGRFNKHTDQAIKADRIAWALSRARMGYTAREIGEALEISICTVSVMLRAAGNNWFDQPRSIRDPRWRNDLRDRMAAGQAAASVQADQEASV